MLDSNKIETIKNDARKEHVPILQDASLEYIENILEKRRPNTILEVGTAVGYSALCFSKSREAEPKIRKAPERSHSSHKLRIIGNRLGFR